MRNVKEEIMETFVFNKESPILLYGAASIGVLFSRYLNAEGFNVVGYIDKRANEIGEFLGKPTYEMDDCRLNQIKGKCIIIVSVKNVFEHSAIAQQLVESGFYNIIYRSINVLNGEGTETEREIYRLFDKIEKKQLKQEEICSCTKFVNRYKIKDRAKIFESENEIIAYVPIELIYTDNPSGSKAIYADISIYALLPHIELFEFFLGNEKGNVNKYLQFCVDAANNLGEIKITDAWKKNVIKNRRMIYDEMSRSLELNYEFFIKNAPKCRWNKKGYFNLCSGKHRAAFFVSRGYRYMPLCIQKEDYCKWINDEIVEFIKRNSLEAKIKSLFYIPHPFFYYLPVEGAYNSHLLYKIIVRGIVQYLEIKRQRLVFSELTVFNGLNLDETGQVSRFLAKMGCKVINNTCDMHECSKILDRLEYVSSIDYKVESDSFADANVYLCDSSTFLRYQEILQKKEDILIYVLSESGNWKNRNSAYNLEGYIYIQDERVDIWCLNKNEVLEE